MISFYFYGHENLLALHRNTIEFTKDDHLTKQGDCIVGVKADFSAQKLKDFSREKKKFRLKITLGDLSEEITASTNPDFDDMHEIVIRKSDFNSSRTFGIRADKAAINLSRGLVEKLKDPSAKGKVEISEIK